MTEDRDARCKQIEQQRAIRVLIQKIERRISAGENRVGVSDVAQVVTQAKPDEEYDSENNGGEQDQRQLQPPVLCHTGRRMFEAAPSGQAAAPEADYAADADTGRTVVL